MKFPEEAKEDIHKIIDKQQRLLQNLLEIEISTQKRLPESF